MTDQNVVNPYSAPTSQVETVNVSGDAVFCPAKNLTAGQGNRIVADAWNIYKVSPFKWTLMSVIMFVIMIVLSMIPIIGSIFGSLFYTPLFAGLLIAARDVEKGEALKFGHLFSAIKANGRGVFGLAFVMSIIGLVNLLVGFMFMGSGTFMAAYSGYMGQEVDPATLDINPVGMIIGFIIMMVGTLVLVMMSWFATPLIALQSVGVFQALGMSFKASLKNWLSLTVYGLIMLFWLFVATIPVGLGLFIMIPLMSITVYTGYRKIFTM